MITNAQHGARGLLPHARTLARGAVALALGLALALPGTVVTAQAATLSESVADAVFVNEGGSTGRCTIYAAANMLRRAALLNGDPDWDTITTASIPSSGGLVWTFTVSTASASYGVAHGYLTGSTEAEKAAELIALLDENPAGIVLYASGGNAHAVTLLSYDEDTQTFIAHDSLTGQTTALDECVTVRVANATAYWYVTTEVADAEADVTSLEGATLLVDDVAILGDDGQACPEVGVTLDGTTLTEGVDYYVTYADNASEGTATVVVTGMGAYTGSVSATFEVVEGTTAFAAVVSEPAPTDTASAETDSQQDEGTLAGALMGSLDASGLSA